MCKKLTSLRDAKFVHSDIREANIMSQMDKNKFMFHGFDWVGRIEEARYPGNVNYMDIERPVDACDGNEISEDHDN